MGPHRVLFLWPFGALLTSGPIRAGSSLLLLGHCLKESSVLENPHIELRKERVHLHIYIYTYLYIHIRIIYKHEDSTDIKSPESFISKCRLA